MNELIEYTQSQIQILHSIIERDKKYYNYPFTENCDHYYRLLLLHNRLANWEKFSKILELFKNSRCKPLEKKSGFFEKVIRIEEEGVPGFVTKKTVFQMIEYMKHLEWKMEEALGSWNEHIQLSQLNEEMGEL